MTHFWWLESATVQMTNLTREPSKTNVACTNGYPASLCDTQDDDDSARSSVSPNALTMRRGRAQQLCPSLSELAVRCRQRRARCRECERIVCNSGSSCSSDGSSRQKKPRNKRSRLSNTAFVEHEVGVARGRRRQPGKIALYSAKLSSSHTCSRKSRIVAVD